MPLTRQYVIRGSVQGVGYRYFVQKAAAELGVVGTVRNRDDGTVEVVVTASEEQLQELAGRLHQGPPAAAVRGVEEEKLSLRMFRNFSMIG